MKRNPTTIAKKYNFILEPFGENAKLFLGTCVCGTKGVNSYGMLSSGKFCINDKCVYFQKQKRIKRQEMEIIAKNKGCEILSVVGTGIRAIIECKCSCGFPQKLSWRRFSTEKWCKHFSCKFRGRLKNITLELLKAWFDFENYMYDVDIEYTSSGNNSHLQKYALLCPENHPFEVTPERWIKGARCEICHGNGRTLSYIEIKEFYEKHGCAIIYTEKDYTGNVSNRYVPYMCPKGHVINNITKNVFNTRINTGLGPCSICRTAGRDRKKEHEKSAETCFERYGVRNPIQHKPFFCKQRKSALKKKYILPSKKVIFLQGYEPRCLRILLQKYNEDQIDIDTIPEIPYLNPDTGKMCKYNADFYIPSENTLIEAKSTYWLNHSFERNKAKFLACRDQGYTLILYVFDDKELLYTKIYSPGKTTLFPGEKQQRILYIPAHPAKLIFPDE